MKSIYNYILITLLSVGFISCTNNETPSFQDGTDTQKSQATKPSRPTGGMGGNGRRNNGMGNMAPYNPLPIDMAPLTTSAETSRCHDIEASVKAAGFADKVEVNCGGGKAYIIANTIPDHDVLTGIIHTNEQTVAPAEGFTQIVRLAPELTNIALTRDASLAVAVNGVPIYDYTGGGEMEAHMLTEHQPRLDTLLTHQLDKCGGHAGRADDYHYHITPNCMIDMMKNKDKPDAIIGWAFDGFPIFRDTNPDGSPIAQGELDVCNGKVDNKYGYRYHTSESAPYIIQCLMGNVENIKRFPRITPPRQNDESKREKEPGTPPRDGVENLTFSTQADGTKSLDYMYKGKPYFIRYTNSETAGCFKYTQRTVTDGGVLVEGEYCR